MAIHVVIPAAGSGRRMQAGIPKQYLQVQGRCIIESTLIRIMQANEISTINVVLDPADEFGRQLLKDLSSELSRAITIVAGGTERWQSVRNAVFYLCSEGCADDWVMVHDAVRPCVRPEDLARLVAFASRNEGCGAILAQPVVDTLKRADEQGGIRQTLDRTDVWAACTPQMFRVGQLLDCLDIASAAHASITDESSAFEFCGYSPHLIPCHKDNIKITYPADLQMADLILRAQRQSTTC